MRSSLIAASGGVCRPAARASASGPEASPLAALFAKRKQAPGTVESSRPEAEADPMPFVVTENCIKCKYTDCVEVCPVDCFHEGPNFLVIDPEECIDCTLCEPECP